MRHLDLFSGIGGFALAARWVGWETVAFCEIDPYCVKVLNKHWPEVPVYGDIRQLTAARLAADGITASIITGGFPCTDISVAGKQAGIEGERSGLWEHLCRIIGEVRPRYAVVENVPALLSGDRGRWFGRVLGDLASIGYDCEWHCIPASHIGAPHRRDRVWIVAYPESEYNDGGNDNAGISPRSETIPEPGNGSGQEGMADTDKPRLERRISQIMRERAGQCTARKGRSKRDGFWLTEPNVGRVVARLSTRLDGGRLNGEDSEGGTREILRALQNPNAAETIQWPIRGFGRIQTSKVLLTELCEYEGSPKPLGNVSLESKETPEVIMRGVWFDGESACPSCRRAASEQRSRKHPDAVCLLPQLLTCDCESTWLDPAGTPSESSRVDRLRCLGNAIVPQIAEIIGTAILEANQ